MEPWWKAEKGEVASTLFDYVATVESEQIDIYDRFLKLDYLYDPNNYFARMHEPSGMRFKSQSILSENVIATNVDTVAAATAATEVRPRFIPDDADWSEQRRARHLEWYAGGLDKRLDVHGTAREGFKDAAKKGTGLVKVYADHDTGEIKLERVLCDDIVVDEMECRVGKPRQMHHRVIVSKDDLASQYPKHADHIRRAHSSSSRWAGWWADYRPINDEEIVVIESWRLPFGKKGTDRYVSGRWTLCIDGYDIFDKEWDKPRFPFARMVWTERTSGYFGISLAERIMGHQRRLNKRNWQIDVQLDSIALPTTYVRLADANLAVKTRNRAGTIVPYKAEMPKTVIPNAVGAEVYGDRESTKASAYEESGMSRMQATSMKPGGLDSGAALREYRDISTQRFSLQEKNFERFILDIFWLCIEAAKELGSKAPEVIRSSRFGRQRIKWSAVDMDLVRIQLQAASPLAKTPAGRRQFVMELAQAGIVSVDSARRMMRLEDTDRELSLYITDLEDLEATFEELLDGKTGIVPEPYQNMEMGTWRGQRHYLKAKREGAPPEVLEGIRQWIVQAAWVVAKGKEQQQAPPMQDPMAGAPPDALMAAPEGAAPVAALAPESLGVATA